MKRRLNMQAKEFMNLFSNQYIITIITLIWAKSVELSESKKKKVIYKKEYFLKEGEKIWIWTLTW